jgi:hypothetical protein
MRACRIALKVYKAGSDFEQTCCAEQGCKDDGFESG